MHTVLVLVVSAAPAIGFMVLILRMDRREPEPLRLVLRVMGLGAASGIIAGLLESALGHLAFFQGTGLGAAAVESFLQVAPLEEGCKLAVVLLFVWGNPNFNEENDGIVYLGASSIGFALLENVMYVTRHGLGTGVLRAFTAVPLHVFTAVVMGLWVGKAKFAAGRPRRAFMIAWGLVMAWVIHGAYDTFAMSKSGIALLLLPLIAGVVTFGILALKRGRGLSLARWGQGRTPPAPADAPVLPMRTHAPLWMAIISRVLLSLSLLFWILLFAGTLGAKGSSLAAAIVGGIVFTALPVTVGILLEHAYRKRRRQWKTGGNPPFFNFS
jgi:protease PrsW